jgi:hypothetical protein
MMKRHLTTGAFWLFFVLSPTAFACGDLDFLCKQREGQLNLPIRTPTLPTLPTLPILTPSLPTLPNIIDPECRGDLCRAGQVVIKETGRTVNNVATELGKAPQAIQECLGNVPRCANEILSAPLASLAQAYIEGLYRQAEGQVQSFSPDFIRFIQPYYDVNLSDVTYAENIDTGHGMTLAYCDRIFFVPTIDPEQDKDSLKLVLHEMEHIVQCKKRGKRTFLAEYLVKGAVEMVNRGQFNIHDHHDFERAANAKADSITNTVWNRIQAQATTGPANPFPNGPAPVPPSPPFPPTQTSGSSMGGLLPGTVMQPCGCFGFTNQAVVPEARCMSGAVHIQQCPGFCQMGGAPYAYLCQ